MSTATQREWLTIKEFRKRFPQFGANLTYEAVRRGELPSIKVLGKILVPSDALGPGWRESAGIFGCPVGGSVADGAVRPGVEWLAAGPRRG